MSTRTLYITLLASEWKSSKGGLSTMNRELAIQLAKHPNVSVTFFVPKCSDEDKRVASSYNVKIVEAKELPGYEPVDWLAFPPKHLVIDFVVGHGVVLGKQAQIVMKSHQCKWVQVVHTAPDELAMYKGYSGAISKGEEKQWAELELCKMADLVVAVGPKLMEFYSAYLNSCGKRVYNFTPGIFTELSSLKLSSQSGKKFRLLVFGRGDTEDFELKGYDIAAQAVAKLNDKRYHLTFVGALKGKETEVTAELLKQGLDRSQLIVKGYLQNREYLTTLLCASNLVIIPSRTEGFGLTALEALSAGLPFLVSQNSGIGEALQEISLGSNFIVDSEDPEQWAEAIKRVRQKGSETAIQECQELRTQYAEKYSWKTQSKELLSIMLYMSSYSGGDQSRKEQEMFESSQSRKQRLPQKFVTPPPVRIAEPLGPLRPPTSLPERSTSREEVQSRSTDARGETREPYIRDQGARPKEKSLSSTESTLDLKERPYADDRAQSTKPDVPVESRAHGISEKTSSSTETIKDLKGDDLSKKEEISEYHPSKQMLPPRPISRLESVVSWRSSSFLPERPYTGDSRVQSTKPVIPVESRANRISDQGARPKEKRSSSTETKDLSIVGERKEESKPQQRSSEINPLRWDTLSLKEKPKTKDAYLITSVRHGADENAALYTEKSHPLQRNTLAFEEKPKTKDTFPSTTCRENAALSTERARRFQEFKTRKRKGLAVLGWNAKPESVYAVSRLIGDNHNNLNLTTDLDVLNLTVHDLILYLENNPLKHCVLVVDAEKVKTARGQEREVDFLRLLQTAERNIAEKIIITVCCPRSLSENDEWIVNCTIAEAFEDNSKVYVTWFVNGKLALNRDDFVMLLTSTITKPYSQQQTFAAQTPSFENIQLGSGQENAASGSSPDVGYNVHGVYSKNCKIFLPTGNTVMVLTRLRNGIISRRREDVQYWMPGFVVPVGIARDLLNKNSKNSNAELVILLNEKGVYTCQVGKKRGSEWQQWILLALDETVVLQTRLKYGLISFEPKDVVIRCQNWRVPQEAVNRLMLNYKATPDADLFVVSDSRGNARMIVQEGLIYRHLSIVRGKQEESESQQRRGESGLQRFDKLRLEDKPKTRDPYPIASAGHATKEHASLYTAKEDNFQRLGGSDPLQWDTFRFEQKPNTTFPSTTYRENAALSTERAGRFQETAPSQFKKVERKDLSVVGWNAKQESLSAVTQLIQKHRKILSLCTDLDVLNFPVNDMILYLENNPLKYCVLVVDAERVKAVRDQEQGVNYLRLLQTAERNVAEKIIIAVCCPRSLSKKDKSIVDRTIEEAFKDNSKVYVTWFVNGKLAEVFAMLFATNQPAHAHETDAGSGASRDFLHDTVLPVLPSVLGALTSTTLPTMLIKKIFGKF